MFEKCLKQEIIRLQKKFLEASDPDDAYDWQQKLIEARNILKMYQQYARTPEKKYKNAEEYCDAVQSALDEAYER